MQKSQTPKRTNKQNTMDVDQNTKATEGTTDLSPPPGTPMNPMVFDLAVMEQRLIEELFCCVYVTPSTSRSVTVLGILYSLTVNERLE